MTFNGQYICPNCFRELSQSGSCPHCGYTPGQKQYPMALPEGTILGGHYLLGRVLGQGGFGITYAAWDFAQGKKVALKEFFPESLATREGGTRRVVPFSQSQEENYVFGRRQFLEEAGALSQFTRCPEIVSVYACFEEKGTAYFTMEFLEGMTFKDFIIAAGGRISWEEACNVLLPVTRALEAVHRAGMVHRDVTPDNIFITREGNIKLLDFGAARYSVGDRSATLDVVLKHGFAPMEQYTAHGRRGPYTDIYSLGACFYLALTGVLPPNALERVNEDELAAPTALGISLPPGAQEAILRAMAVRASERYQTIEEFRRELLNRQPQPEPVPPAPKKASRKGLILGLSAAVVLLTAALVTVLALSFRDTGSAARAEEEDEEISFREDEDRPVRVPQFPGAPTDPPEETADPGEKVPDPTDPPAEPPVEMAWLGGIYRGPVVQELPQGQGFLLWDCGTWEGSFEDGFPAGDGVFTTPEGETLSGSWTWGTVDLTYERGMAKNLTSGSYHGLLLEGVPTGYGEAEYLLGGSYTGGFREGHPLGNGIYRFRGGAVLSGQWEWTDKAQDSLDPDKLGTKMYYTGMVLDGIPQGFGLLQFESCGSFHGEFRQGEPEGYGAYYYRCPESCTYLEGDSWQMVYHDYRYSNDYSGLKLDGLWQGFGIGVMSSGNHYVGEILNDYRDGYGRVFLQNQTEDPNLCGIFRSGTFLRKLS